MLWLYQLEWRLLFKALIAMVTGNLVATADFTTWNNPLSLDSSIDIDGNYSIRLLNIPQEEWMALSDLYENNGGADWEWFIREDLFGSRWNFTGGYDAHNPCAEAWQYIECSCLLDLGINSIHPKSDYPEIDYYYYYYYSDSEGVIEEHSVAELTCHIEKLHMISIGLTGQIPESIAGLANLTALHLDKNQLTGDLSRLFSRLPRIARFSVAGNLFTGNFPLKSGLYSELFSFHIWDNYITGSIPSSLSIPLMESFALSNNHLHGPFPDIIFGDCRYLKGFYVVDNQFTGSYPELRNCSSLELYVAGGDHFSGQIPVGLFKPSLQSLSIVETNLVGSLSDIEQHINSNYPNSTFDLRVLIIAYTLLSGAFPNSQLWSSHFPVLENIALPDNLLTGSIPTDLCQASQLQVIVLNGNQFSGSFPSCFAASDTISSIQIPRNLITGTFPCSLLDNNLLQNIDVSANFMENSIACAAHQTIGAEFRTLQYSYNLFTGTVPLNLIVANGLSQLFLSYNLFTGYQPLIDYQQRWNISTSIVSQLVVLDISFNPLFSSGFPIDWLPLLPTLQTFGAANTCLFPSHMKVSVADIFSAFCWYTPNISFLSLNGANAVCREQSKVSNLITVRSENSLPSCVFEELNALNYFGASGCALTGSIPSITDTDSLESLKTLILSNNKLTGSIPIAFQEKYWDNFDVSHNKLNGILRTGSSVWHDNCNDILKDDSVASNNISASSVVLTGNRLSGYLPSIMHKTWSRLSVLEGNYFTCSLTQSDLPPDDPATSTYSCGSNSVDVLLYIFCGFLFAAVAKELISAMKAKPSTSVVVPVSVPQESTSQPSLEAGYVEGAQVVPSTTRFGEYCCAASEWIKTSLQCMFCQSNSWPSASIAHDQATSSASTNQQINTEQLRSNSVFIGIIVQAVTRFCALLVCIILPLYLGLGSAYKTHSVTYAYGLSVGFLSGLPPAILVLVAWWVAAVVILWPFMQLRQVGRVVDRSSSIEWQLRISSTQSAVAAAEASTANASDHKRLLKMKLFVRIMGVAMIVLLGVVGTMAFIVAINIAFLYSQFHLTLQYRIMTQCVMSSCKLLLGRHVLPRIFSFLTTFAIKHIGPFVTPLNTINEPNRTNKQLLRDISTRWQLTLEAIFGVITNVLAPIIATAIYDANCFYYLAVSELPKAVSSYQLSFCQIYDTPYYCSVTTTTTVNISFQPKYNYSFLCATSLLVNYCFVFLFMVLIDGLVKPIISSSLMRIRDSNRIRSSEQQQQNHQRRRRQQDALLEANDRSLITFIVNYIAILVTFGIAFVPLGIVLSIHLIVVLSNQKQLIENFERNLNDLSFYQSLPTNWFAPQSAVRSSNIEEGIRKANTESGNIDNSNDNNTPLIISLEDSKVKLVKFALITISNRKLKNCMNVTTELMIWFVIPLQILLLHLFVFDMFGDVLDWPIALIIVSSLLFVVVCSVCVLRVRSKSLQCLSKVPTSNASASEIEISSHENNASEKKAIEQTAARIIEKRRAERVSSEAQLMLGIEVFNSELVMLMEVIERQDQLIDVGIDAITMLIGFLSS